MNNCPCCDSTEIKIVAVMTTCTFDVATKQNTKTYKREVHVECLICHLCGPIDYDEPRAIEAWNNLCLKNNQTNTK